jgi:hypothetical protein
MSVGRFLELETDINQLSASVYINVGWVSKIVRTDQELNPILTMNINQYHIKLI